MSSAFPPPGAMLSETVEMLPGEQRRATSPNARRVQSACPEPGVFLTPLDFLYQRGKLRHFHLLLPL